MDDLCFLCDLPAEKSCSKCPNQTAFCCQLHEALHLNPTDGTCLPFIVKRDPDIGRYLEATRDIQPGELIIHEVPVAVGNLHETSPVCLTCWMVVDGSYHCEECGLPMCERECSQASVHRDNECRIFSRKKGPVIQSDSGEPHPFYECITPLRTLLLKNSQRNKWAAVEKMMDHTEDRPATAYWEICQHNIVKFLLEKWSLKEDGFTEADVNHVIGSLEVNAFEISTKPFGKGRGVFPLTALMSHSCVSNARYIIHDDYHVDVRATSFIPAGSEITDHYVSPLNGTLHRRGHLRDGWYFNCRCQRCQDPTEFGTWSSALLCQCGGPVVSQEPLSYLADWQCKNCDKNYPWDSGSLVRLENEILEQLDDNEVDIKQNVSELEKLLEMVTGHFYPTHFLNIAIKRYLLYGYTSNEKTDDEVLARKSEYAKDVLKVYNVLCPGLTKERGLTLFELFAANIELAKRLAKAGEQDRMKILDIWKQCKIWLTEASQCLQFERSGSFEHMVKRATLFRMKEVDDFIEKHDNLLSM